MEEDKAEQLYNLELFEKMDIGGAREIVRVPGGWVMYSSLNGRTSMVFIPFDNEFQSVKTSSIDDVSLMELIMEANKNVVRELPKITIKGTEYYIDERLKEWRSCKNPHERIPFHKVEK